MNGIFQGLSPLSVARFRPKLKVAMPEKVHSAQSNVVLPDAVHKPHLAPRVTPRNDADAKAVLECQPHEHHAVERCEIVLEQRVMETSPQNALVVRIAVRSTPEHGAAEEGYDREHEGGVGFSQVGPHVEDGVGAEHERPIGERPLPSLPAGICPGRQVRKEGQHVERQDGGVGISQNRPIRWAGHWSDVDGRVRDLRGRGLRLRRPR
mmetsp:Transcript_33669/g.68741  ORF Transcript_33669/g.68741 Transcript_33669/m.68741 type:complete len:208 (-) Transcript_33669:111-734(-)